MESNKRKFISDFLLTEEANGSVEIRFEAQSVGKKYRFFEVSQSLLSEINEAGCRIVGDNSSDAVLCTSSKTYSIKKVETSNSIYLVPPSSQPHVYWLTPPHREYYEVTPTTPRIEKLHSFLSLSSYYGKVNETNPVVQANLISRSSLQEVIQASDEEISTALSSLETIEIDGFLRLVDKDALREMTANLLDTIMENRWEIDHITDRMCFDVMDESTDEYLLYSALNSLSLSKSSVSDGVWKLDYGLVSRSVAKKLFRTRLTSSRERTWPVEDFLLTWSINLPSVQGQPTVPPVEYLSGIAIREQDLRKGKQTPMEVFFYLDSEDLSSSSKTRFQQLFELRPKYSLDDIQPYLKEFFGHSNQPKTIHELLLLHTLLIDGFYYLKPE